MKSILMCIEAVLAAGGGPNTLLYVLLFNLSIYAHVLFFILFYIGLQKKKKTINQSID